MFLIKASSRKATSKRENNWGCCYFLFEKKTVKLFVHCHVFAQSPPGRRPTDKYPVNTSHRFQFFFLMLHLQYYLVATVLHAQSLRRQICAYIHIIHNIETLVGQKNLKKRESSECRVPFRVCAPLVRQPCRRASGSAQVFIVLVGLCRNEDFISCSVGSDVSNTRSAELCDVAGSRFDMCVCVYVYIYLFVHLVVCLTTGPRPLPKRTLYIVRSRASSFK